MEEKKYEAGRVAISSAEYRDLVKEATEASRDASEARSRRWELENELSKTKKELEETQKKVRELESIIEALRANPPLYNIPASGRPLRLDEMITYSQTPTKEDF